MREGPRDRFRKAPRIASPPFAAAIACALVLYLPIFTSSPHLFLLSASVFSGAGIAIVSGSRERRFLYLGILLLASSFGFLLGGGGILRLSFDREREFLGFKESKVLSYTGTLVEDSRPIKGGMRMLTISLESVSSKLGDAGADGSLRIILKPGREGENPIGEFPSLDSGLKVKIRGRAESGDDGEQLLFGLESDLEILGWKDPLQRFRSGIKASILSAIDRIGGSGRGLFKALFLGVKDDLEDEETEAFKQSGCVHILALSGMHLSILAALLSFLLIRVFGRKITLLINFLLIIFYVFVAGVQASILRAAFMYGLFVLASALERPVEGMNLLSLSFLLAAGIDPGSAYTLSFILSYLALFGIFLLESDLEVLLRRWLPPILAKPIAASIAAQISTSPVTAICFGTVYPGGILTTAASGPLVTAFMWAGMAATLVSLIPLPIAGRLAGMGLSLIHQALMAVISAGGKLPQLILNSEISKRLFLAALALALVLLYVGTRTRILRRISGWKNPTTTLPPA